jgi:hypothetical protein
MCISSIPDLADRLTSVRFPEGDEVSSGELVRLRREIRGNMDELLSFVQDLIPREAGRPSHLAILMEIRKEVLELRQQCGKLRLLILSPRRRSQRLQVLRTLYEEIRTSSVLLCQQTDSRYTDAVASAL